VKYITNVFECRSAPLKSGGVDFPEVIVTERPIAIEIHLFLPFW
jgi:hypothetical protein